MDLGLHGKRAVQLRYLQTMREVTSERNTTTFLPLPFDLFTRCSRPSAPRLHPRADHRRFRLSVRRTRA
jgi:hypothetical protein